MSNDRSILCGDVQSNNLPTSEDNVVRLSLLGQNPNITLSIDDIRKYLFKDITPRLKDLLEIATYVYCADQAVTRGGNGVENFGEHWRRHLYFRVAVREPDFWNSPNVLDALTSTLGFLSDDEYRFEFVKTKLEHPFEPYFNFFDDNTSLGNPERVVMYSGGLDSLGGAVQEAVLDRRKVILITHKPTQKLNTRHKKLQELLAKHGSPTAPLHINVSINKEKKLGREYTQRSRSFLYASLGAIIAEMLSHSSIYFYENGIISLNLPPCGQVVGARATRTTHPKVIEGFSKILSLVADRTFKVETPFLWKTKGEVVELIGKAGCAEMIRFATSCTHTWDMTKLHTHCGTCSQCIDRRFAVLAAGQESEDPDEAYKIDLLTGERSKDEHRTMLASYVETANEIQGMNDFEFFSKFGEASRVLRHIDGTPESVAQRILDLHRRHAAEVAKVIDAGLSKHAAAIRRRELPASSLLRLVCESQVPIVEVNRNVINQPSPGIPIKKARPKKRAPRAAAIDAIKQALREHLRAARDHAFSTRDSDNGSGLLPRPTQDQLARQLNIHISSVSRAINDKSDKEIAILWEAANDLEQVMRFKG